MEFSTPTLQHSSTPSLVMTKRLLIKYFRITLRELKGFVFSLKQNWGLRILALIIALSVWVYVLREKQVEVLLTIPLNLKVAKDFQCEAYSTNGNPIENITLKIMCAVRDKEALREFDYKSEIDLTEEKENTIPSYLIEMDKDVKYVRKGGNPKDYTVTAISPDRIKIIIDRSERRNIPVKPDVVGKPANGYQVTKVEVNPSAVLVKGPERLLKELEFISTEPVLIDGITKALRRDKKILTGDPNIVPVNQLTVEVTVGINTKPVQKKFNSIKINSFGRDNVSFSPTSVSVVLEAQKQFMDVIGPSEIAAFVDARTAPAGCELPVKFLPIENCNVISVMPETVTVNMRTFTEQ